MIKRSKVIYASQTEPVTTEEAKTQLYITNSDRNTHIARLNTTSVGLCEAYSGLSFITQTRQLKLDCFPSCYPYAVTLPYGPVIAISGNDTAASPNTLGISYVKDDLSTGTLVLNTDFYLDNNSDVARLSPVDSWPTDVDLRINAITITYTAGYGAASSVPAIIKDAILTQTAFMHEHPDSGELCEGAMSKLDLIKVYHNAWAD